MRTLFTSLAAMALTSLATAQVSLYSQDFEGLAIGDPGALGADGWLVGANVFDPTGTTFFYNYFAFPAPNGGPAFSAIIADASNPPQGAQQIVVYNDYNNGTEHGLGNLVEAVFFRESVIGAGDVGSTFEFTFDARQQDLAAPVVAQAFIKILDPLAGYSATAFETQDTSALPGTWSTFTLSTTIDPSQVGQIFQIGMDSTGSNFTPSGIAYDNVSLALAPAALPGDECAAAIALASGAQTVVGIDTTPATTSSEASACDGATSGGAGVQNDLWYEWSPDVDGIWIVSTCNISAVDTNLGLWTGCATELLCDEDTGGCAGFTTELAAVLSSATTYQIRLGGWGAGDSGISDLDISQAPLTNDECEAPTVISGAGTTTFDSTGATASPSSGLASDVWYEWTPDFAGDYNFSTCSQADFDTLIVLWNACPLAAGTPLGFNDDGPGCAGFTSDLDVAGLNTIPYYIAVSGFGGATGTGDLTITCTSCVPPANNDCAGATPMIEGANAHDHGNFSTASGQDATGLPPFVDTDTPDTACEVFNATPDALNIDNWYSFTAPANSGYVFDACDSASYDSKLAIYSGACGSLTALACNDDGTGCTGFTSTLQVTGLSAGQTYLVQVGGFGAADAGTATINVSRRSGTQNYCTTAANSVGAGAVMASSGSTSIAADDLVVECSGLPDDFAIFFFGAAKDNTQNAGFNGVHCVSNPIRLPAVILVAGGSASRAVTNAELGGPGAGNTVFFQCFYRDHGNLGNGANTSDAIAVTLGL
jgi:hypothetical protein